MFENGKSSDITNIPRLPCQIIYILNNEALCQILNLITFNWMCVTLKHEPSKDCSEKDDEIVTDVDIIIIFAQEVD